MGKKEYTTPELKLLGDVEELTRGEGFSGSDDQFYFFSWGSNDPDPTSG